MFNSPASFTSCSTLALMHRGEGDDIMQSYSTAKDSIWCHLHCMSCQWDSECHLPAPTAATFAAAATRSRRHPRPPLPFPAPTIAAAARTRRCCPHLPSLPALIVAAAIAPSCHCLLPTTLCQGGTKKKKGQWVEKFI
jgi:hypothetical protein